jgi:tRNA dimethylallyltransferase
MKVVQKTFLKKLNKLTPIYITGPTGVGKSAFATLLSLQIGGEIVGADAFQIYHDLPILSSQPSQEEQRSVDHHLIGILPITELCDAALYREMALQAIHKIETRNHFSMITGGTGLYIRSLISPLDILPKGNETLRASFALLSQEALIARLKELDPTAGDLIDIKNRRRIERALEIVIQSGSPLHEVWRKKKEPLPPSFGFFLFREREELYKRLELNVKNMFLHGVVDEVAALDSQSISKTASMALGLREIQAHLSGEISLQTTIEKITRATKHYAKRQITWFNNQHHFLPWNLSHFSSMEEAVKKAAITLSHFQKNLPL